MGRPSTQEVGGEKIQPFEEISWDLYNWDWLQEWSDAPGLSLPGLQKKTNLFGLELLENFAVTHCYIG